MPARLLLLVSAACLVLAPAIAAPQRSAAAVSDAPAPDLSRPDVATLVGMLRDAEAQGFAPDDFGLASFEPGLDSADVAIRARAQARLEAAAIAYARAQHGLRMTSFPRNWAVRPARYDAAADFSAALAQNRLAQWSASLPPPHARYAALLRVYARYRDIAARGGWPMVPRGPSLKLGATGERVEALRQRLAIEDPGVVAAPPGPAGPAPDPTGAAPGLETYDQALADAVSRAQARYGLKADGVAGPATLQALNVPVGDRLAQIRANLERWRWAPRQLPAYRVELNIAAQTLELYDGDKPALGMRAIVGKPSKPTPMFQDHIRAVIFNPPWNVPQDIAIKEIWPKIRKHPGYMKREGFVVKPDGTLQQLPGPKCALGTIKFDLGNPFGVYLHDTPARSLFAGERRTLSHGCMRLADPNALAKRLLQGTPGWEDWRVDAAIASGTTQRVELPTSVPVFVFYWTVFLDGNGQVDFRPDAYGWDARLLSMLGERS